MFILKIKLILSRNKTSIAAMFGNIIIYKFNLLLTAGYTYKQLQNKH